MALSRFGLHSHLSSSTVAVVVAAVITITSGACSLDAGPDGIPAANNMVVSEATRRVVEDSLIDAAIDSLTHEDLQSLRRHQDTTILCDLPARVRSQPTVPAFELLRQRATADRLRSLLDHPNGIIRGFALLALRDRNILSFQDILRAITDTTGDGYIVERCIVGGTINYGNLHESMLTRIILFRGAVDSWLPARSADSLRLMLIEKFGDLLTDDLATDRYLRWRLPFPGGYRALRRLTYRSSSVHAVIALARYRFTQDLPLLRRTLRREHEKACLIVTAFPHASLIPIMEKIQREEIAAGRFNGPDAEYFYQTVAAFDHQTYVRFIKRASPHAPNLSLTGMK